jgi:hypothetical protein
MKGDFSRIRFEPNKHYTDVLDQQGRIAYDADHNEQRFIDRHRRTVQTVDVIGPYGAPLHDAGFGISLAGTRLRIGAGRYYVQGLLCENAAALYYDEQPFLIESGGPAHDIAPLLEELRRNRNACVCVYLEVWQRMVTALDDSCLGEPALGQADTTVRLQTVWRVVAQWVDPPTKQTASIGGNTLRILEKTINPCTCEALYGAAPVEHTGTLNAQVTQGGDDCGCQPLPAAGFTGQENQLYRFEIQRGGPLESATVKWSRENGSIVAAILTASGNKVTVDSLGRDANLGFQEGQWVEIGDDSSLFGTTPNTPGQLYQVQNIDRPSRTVTLTTTVQVDVTRNARMRRWDQAGTTATADGVPLSESWISIENGIQVRFGAGTYYPGDAWTIAARSATGTIDWPPCGSDGNPFQPPHYTEVYRAPLACIQAPQLRSRSRAREAASYNPYQIHDCRRIFPNLTDLARLVETRALHITGINWNNDDVVTFDTLVRQGLAVQFDQAPGAPLSPATFMVTLEMPRLMDTQTGLTQEFAMQSLLFRQAVITPTLIRAELLLESTVTLNGTTVAWTLPGTNVFARQSAELTAIDRALAPWASRGTPVRVRVKLPGRLYYATGTTGQVAYLDGQAFGVSADTAAGDRTRIDLRFPTGDEAHASDFESWFYLYPTLAIDSVAFNYTEVTLGMINDTPTIIAAQPDPKTKPIVLQATIQLTYQAVTPATIALSLSGDPNLISVPASAAVNAGDSSVTVNMIINGVPPAGAKTTFTLTASLPSALGQSSSATGSFTAAGRGQNRPVPAPG